MKILQVLPELNSGGVERGTLELAQHLASKGEESFVMSAGGKLVTQLEAEGSTHITLPVHRKSPSSLFQIAPLRKRLTQHRFDIIHLRSRVPAWISLMACGTLAPSQRPRIVTTVHGLNSVSPYSAVMTKGERVICVSEAAQSHVLKNYPKVNSERLEVIPRGIDPEFYQATFTPSSQWQARFLDEFPETNGKQLLTLPGRITRLKGHHDFFNIIAQLPSNVHGLVAGGCAPKKQAYLDELKKHLDEKGLSSRITFTGQRSDLREILSHSQVAFSLSTTPESFGRTTLEALSLSVPVIGYDHGGVGEILATCFPKGCCPMGDTTTAALLAKDLLENPYPISAPGPYTLVAMLEGTHALYKRLLAEQLR